MRRKPPGKPRQGQQHHRENGYIASSFDGSQTTMSAHREPHCPGNCEDCKFDGRLPIMGSPQPLYYVPVSQHQEG